MTITNLDALSRTIDHREIFHDEMLALMRRIMSGEMSPVMMAALLIGLRVKKETIGEITAAAQVDHLHGRSSRKFFNIAWPCSVRMDSGWNCTPSSGAFVPASSR